VKNDKNRGGFENTIRELKHKDPFTPFKIVMASGDKYLIEDPEMMVMSSTEIIYIVPRTEQVVFIRKSQITSLEQFHKKPAA